MHTRTLFALVTLTALSSRSVAHAQPCEACVAPAPPVLRPPAPPEVWEERRNDGLMTAGLVVFGTSYTATALSAPVMEQPRLTIPLIGPILVAHDLHDDFLAPLARSLAIVTVVLQAGGLTMAIAGAATHRRVQAWR